MKPIIYYEAEDGTRFANFEDCLEYEQHDFDPDHRSDIQMWDVDENPCDYDHAFAISIKTEDAAKKLKTWGDDFGSSTPFDNEEYPIAKGNFIYQDEIPFPFGSWLSMEDIHKWVDKMDKLFENRG